MSTPESKGAPALDGIARGVGALPRSTASVLELSTDPEVSLASLVAELSKDKAIARRILALANSPVFRPISPISDLKVAIARLGIRTTVELAVALGVLDVTGSKGAVAKELREQSVGHGAMSRVMGLEYSSRGLPDIFLGSIMHDIGLLVLVQKSIAPTSAPPPQHDDECYRSELVAQGYSHADLSAALATKWQLGDDVVALAREHHMAKPQSAEASRHEVLRISDAIERGLAKGQDKDAICDGLEDLVAGDSVPPSRVSGMWPTLMEARETAKSAILA